MKHSHADLIFSLSFLQKDFISAGVSQADRDLRGGQIYIQIGGGKTLMNISRPARVSIVGIKRGEETAWNCQT